MSRSRQSPAVVTGLRPSGDRLLRQHHLQLAGRSDPLFSDDALSLVHQTSRGIPRAVNNLAVQALIAAFADGKGMVDERAARAAIAEVTAEELSCPPARRPRSPA